MPEQQPPGRTERRGKHMDVLKNIEKLSRLDEIKIPEEDREELLKTTKTQLSTVADSIQQLGMVVDTRAQMAEQDIKQSFARLSQSLEARKKELLSQVDQIRKAQWRILDKQFVQLNVIHQEIANYEAFQYGGGDTKLSGLNTAHLMDLSPQDFGISFTCPVDCLISNLASFGNVNVKISESKGDVSNETIQVLQISKKFQGIALSRKFGSRGPPPGRLNRPWDVSVNVNIAVADRDNHCIQIFTTDGHLLNTIGSFGSGPGEFNSPMGIATTGNGEIIVADCYNHRVQVFSMDGKFIRSFGSKGTGDGQFMYPNDVALTKEGRIPVADYANDRIQVFDPNGNFLFKFGSPTPSGVCVTSDGKIIVTDNTNNCIRIFSADGYPIKKFGTEGSDDGQFRCWTYCPLSATVDDSDCIYVTDPDNHRVQIFTKDGIYLNQFGGHTEFSPFGVAVSPKGEIIVADGGGNCVSVYHKAEAAQ